MKILAHRGFWKKRIEQNSLVAFAEAFDNGFGIETDIRDFKGELVISHDIPTEGVLPLDEFFQLCKKYKCAYPLALNIKSDGLQEKLKQTIAQHRIENYFVFDMSVPDGLHYVKHQMNTFTRGSEYESTPAFYDDAIGIWLDEFQYHWVNKKVILNHLTHKKLICIVSPELHKRSYMDEWKDYRCIEREVGQGFMICTDHPVQAKEFFGEEKN